MIQFTLFHGKKEEKKNEEFPLLYNENEDQEIEEQQVQQ